MEESRSEEAIEKMADNRCEMQFTFTTVFFENSVEYVLGTTHDYFAFKKHPYVLEVPVHLDIEQSLILIKILSYFWQFLHHLS